MDEDLTFTPFHLSSAVTTGSVLKAKKEGQFGRALSLALHLDSHQLIEMCIYSIPLSDIQGVCTSIPNIFITRLLRTLTAILGQNVQSNDDEEEGEKEKKEKENGIFRVEFILRFLLCVLQFQGAHLLQMRDNRQENSNGLSKNIGSMMKVLQELRGLNRALWQIKSDVMDLCVENLNALKLIQMMNVGKRKLNNKNQTEGNEKKRKIGDEMKGTEQKEELWKEDDFESVGDW